MTVLRSGAGVEREIARAILSGFDKHYRLFREASVLAKARWEQGDWAGVRDASRDRIAMYDQRVEEAYAVIDRDFPDAHDASRWQAVKLAYFMQLYEHKQPECAETFFNSVARRLLARPYFENDMIFRRPAISTEHLDGHEPTYASHYPRSEADLGRVFHDILGSFSLNVPFADRDRDVANLLRAVREEAPADWRPEPNFQLQVLRSLFFRNKAAYIVGRVLNGNEMVPFVVALRLDEERRVFVDTVLLTTKDVGRLFSLGHSYFMVDMEVPSAFVEFLGTLVPSKPRADLYTLVGLQKQGKTLFFRDLEQHLLHSSDELVLARGTRGMVMLVFTLPSFPYVFKVIRDYFEPPKDADKKHVMERYEFVKKHDRAGRMADTLEYKHVAFPRHRVSKDLLAELERIAATSHEVTKDAVVIKHLYAERRLIPLDLYLSGADDARLEDGIREYGNAVKDLARANLFPGDLLIKNFGVTRFGRIAFYDYDELVSLTDCRFREMPRARDDDEEMSSEPWYAVGPGDVFPEQFPRFLFPPGRARDLFIELHGDLAQASFWREQQERLRAGISDDVFPYPAEKRFGVRWTSAARRSSRAPAPAPTIE